jgi:hypothetical protein
VLAWPGPPYHQTLRPVYLATTSITNTSCRFPFAGSRSSRLLDCPLSCKKPCPWPIATDGPCYAGATIFTSPPACSSAPATPPLTVSRDLQLASGHSSYLLHLSRLSLQALVSPPSASFAPHSSTWKRCREHARCDSRNSRPA